MWNIMKYMVLKDTIWFMTWYYQHLPTTSSYPIWQWSNIHNLSDDRSRDKLGHRTWPILWMRWLEPVSFTVGNLRVKPLVACSDTIRDYSDRLKHIQILDFAWLCQDSILYYTGILIRLILTLQVDCIHPYSPIPTWQTTSIDLSICFV